MLTQGIDPGVHKKAIKETIKADSENSFAVICREWFVRRRDIWVKGHTERIMSRFENDISPFLGAKPIHQITAPELLDALRKVEARGAIETAHRIMQSCGQVFRYAIATGRAERDPASDLRGALSSFKSGSFATITESEKIGMLLRDIDAYTGNVIVCAALKIAPYVFVRPGKLRRAEWSEFNLEKKEWRIPAEKMKLRQIHIVPLASGHIYPERITAIHRGWAVSVSFVAGQQRAYFRRDPFGRVAPLGYGKEDMTVHGFRSMASTAK